MVPRADIVSVDETTTISDLLKVFASAGHSRLPVYRGTLDDPIGMVHIKDLMLWVSKQGSAKKTSRRQQNRRPPSRKRRTLRWTLAASTSIRPSNRRA